jgi:hypothetical protein
MTRALVVMCSLVPVLALAQGKVLKDKEEIKFNEIERGFTVEMAAGGQMMFSLPGNSIVTDTDMTSPTFGKNIGCKPGPFSGGEVVRVGLGADIGSRGDDPRSAVPLMVVTAMMQVGQMKAGSDYLGTSSGVDMNTGACLSTSPKTLSGDFSMLGAALSVKVNIFGISDSQDIKRTWLYARAAGGVNFFFPQELIGQTDILIQGGVGVEYYTRLRHFAIGLEAMFQMLFVTTRFGVTITPTLRYSF